MFWTYFELGYQHISDIKGYDHILFLIAMCAVFESKDWKKISLLVTAFTIGHSITLALATFNIIPINGYWIELLIPVTIALTSVRNIWSISSKQEKNHLLMFMF